MRSGGSANACRSTLLFFVAVGVALIVFAVLH
jgi:hypothetical protein